MTIHVFLLIALGIGIFVGIKSKKLTWVELIVCGSFGILLGATVVGKGINGFILNISQSLIPPLTTWLR